MFENKEYIKNIVSMRDDGEIVIPLYIQIYGQKYSLLELDTIKKRFSRSVFKVGFATADAFFMNNSFPVNRINEFNLIQNLQLNNVDVEDNDKLNEEIHMYFDILFNNVKERVDSYFKSLIEQETVPLIPNHIPIAYEKDDDIQYPSADDEDDEYVDEEESIFEDDEDDDEEESSEVAFEFENDYDDEYDSLEDLRKEVEEYSHDEEDNNLLIVETDNTGTEIESVTEATLDLPKDVEIGDGLVDMFGNEVNDDYLSEEDGYPRVTEGGLIGKETVEFINEEGKYSDDNEDYSTDFDVY